MKANKIPEKIYFDGESSACKQPVFSSRNIEYTRTDAFIEKACEFLKSYRQDTYDGIGYIAGIVNDKTIEDFKKYMEGEQVWK